MAKYLIQTYNRDMTELIREEDYEDSNVEDVLGECYDRAMRDSVIVLMRRNIDDPTRLRLIAKFY